MLYREVNFPSVLMIPPGTSVKLPRGMPLVQVIPIKREDFQSEFPPLDMDKYGETMQSRLPDPHNFYRNDYWRKKKYH